MPQRWAALAAALLPAACVGAGSADFGLFRSWLVERGASFAAKLEVGEDVVTGLRGLLLQEEVANGKTLFELPSNLVLSTDAVRQQGVAWQQLGSCSGGGDGGGSGTCAAASGGGSAEILSPTHTAFALFLLEQRAPGAPWQPWVASLPEAFQGFPILYGEEDLKGLQASPLRKVVELDQDAVSKDFALAAGARGNLSLEEFRWARTAVKSRVFGLKSLSGGGLEEEVIAMIPLADFVNHPPDGVVEANVEPAYDAKTGSFRFSAVRDMKRGEGLYWDYGFKSNRNSLLRYGFVSQRRVPLTDMPLFFKLTDFPGAAGTAQSLKLKWIEKAKQDGLLAAEDDGTVFHELSLSLTSHTSAKLLGHARFMVLQPKNATVLEEMCPATFCTPVSLANERAALKHLAELLEALTASYGTTVAEDAKLMEESPKEGAVWQTLVVRYGEKQVLRGFGRLLGAMDPLFDLSPWALAGAVAEHWNNSASDIHRYVQETVTLVVEAEGLKWAKRKTREGRAKAA